MMMLNRSESNGDSRRDARGDFYEDSKEKRRKGHGKTTRLRWHQTKPWHFRAIQEPARRKTKRSKQVSHTRNTHQTKQKQNSTLVFVPPTLLDKGTLDTDA